MFGRKKQYNGAIHLKRNTKGTSNEISFNVLEGRSDAFTSDTSQPNEISFDVLETARREAIEREGGGEKRKWFKSKNANPLVTGNAEENQSSKQQSNHSSKLHIKHSRRKEGTQSAGTSLAAPSSVSWENRKAALKRAGIAVILALAVAALVFGVVLIRSGWEESQTGAGKIKIALQHVISADTVLVQMDNLLSEDISTSSFESMNTVKAEIPNARKELEFALNTIESLSDDFLFSNESTAAEKAKVSIEARLEMLDAGELLLDVPQNTVTSLNELSEGWNLLFEADEEAREAASKAANASMNDYDEIISKTDSALASFQKAKSLFEQVQAKNSLIDYSQLIVYAGKRAEALEHARASNVAIVENENTELAIAENNLYNALDAEAAEIAKSFPEDPLAELLAQYNAAVADYVDAYKKARSQAAESDEYLRSYLSK